MTGPRPIDVVSLRVDGKEQKKKENNDDTNFCRVS